jgi:hypothetical protein
MLRSLAVRVMKGPLGLSRTRRLATTSVVVAFLLKTGCAPALVCPRQGEAPIDARCLEGNLREGEEVSVRMLDGSIHRGSFVRLEHAADSASFVLNQSRTARAIAPDTLSFNVAAIDSVSEVRRATLLEPIPVVAEIVLLGTLLYMLIASQINLSGLN